MTFAKNYLTLHIGNVGLNYEFKRTECNNFVSIFTNSIIKNINSLTNIYEMPMKKLFLSLLLAMSVAIPFQATPYKKIVFPDIPGYKTLKGDFHIHTVFSDATVWPTTRVQEALMEGLDVICITDHAETRLQKNILNGYFNPEKVDRNTSYEIAKKAGGKNLIVIRGAEITRGMPPGHWNCLFTKDNNAICKESEKFNDNEVKAMEAGLKEARAQGAFTMWNHPMWEKQAPDTTIMWPEHKKLLKEGYMKGIEVVNHLCGYSPESFQWALDNNLTMFANSDCHSPFFTMVDYENGDHRPVTLVFAKEKNASGVREALDNQRTAVFAYGNVYGREDFVKPLFEESVKVENLKVSASEMSFTLHNYTTMTVELNKGKGSEKFYYPRYISIPPMGTVTVKVRPLLVNNKSQKFTPDEKIVANFKVINFLVGPDKPLNFSVEGVAPQPKKK